MTLPVRTELLARYPALAQVPPDSTLDTPLPSPYSLGVRLDYSMVGNLIPNVGQVKGAKDVKEEEPQAQSKEDREDESTRLMQEELDITWSDGDSYLIPLGEPEVADSSAPVALYLGAEVVGKCRAAVHERLGYTCSAGIAPNKMLAKLCSAWKKPNAQVGDTLSFEFGCSADARPPRRPSFDFQPSAGFCIQ